MITLKNQIYHYDLEDDVVPVIFNLNDESDPDWILYNGVWDDTGHWYDTSYWNDGVENDPIISTSVAFSSSKALKLLDLSSYPSYQTPFFNIRSTRVNPVRISSWVYTSSEASTTNLCGVGIFNDQNITLGSNSDGYYAVVDTRNGTSSTAGFQIRHGSGSSVILDSDDTLTVSSDTWYKVELYINDDDEIVAKLYNTDLDLISTLTSTDSTLTTGYFALMAYEESYFDEIHILGDKEVTMGDLEWMNGYEEYKYDLAIVSPSDQTEIVAYISDYTELTIGNAFNDIDEISFMLPYKVDIDGTENPVWDNVYEEVNILLQVRIDDLVVEEKYFVVDSADLIDRNKEIKEVHAFSKEYKFGKKKIINFSTDDTPTKLWDSSNDWDNEDPSASGIMNYILEYNLQNTWSVVYMNSSLTSLRRTFDISKKSVLETFKEIQKQFNCVFIFDTSANTISIKTYDEVGTNKGLILDVDNYIKTLSKKIKVDEIVTRLYVEGDKDAIISGSNITGQSYIDDFSYFRSTDYMSQSLLDALDAYDIVVSNNEGNFATYLSTLSTKQSELSDLNYNVTTGLLTLQTELIVIQDHLDECQKYGTSGGQNYTYWLGQETSKEAEIVAKELEITNKEAEITAVEADIATIGSNVSYANNFTTAQLQELNNFIYEDTVKCNSEDSDILIAYGQVVLADRSQPPIEFSVEIVDVFGAKSEQFAWEKLSVGDLVTVNHANFSIDTEVRVMGYQYNTDSSSLSIDFSNKDFWDDDLNYLNDIISNSKQVTETVEKQKFQYIDYYANDKDTINDFITSPIDSSDNEVLIGGGATINRRGLVMTDVTDSLGQMKILGNRIIFTQDNWDSYSTAITPDGVKTTGEFKLYSENEYGGQSIVQITGDGIEIYGSETAGQGIIIYNKDDDEVFSLDTSGNIVMTGDITMVGGSIDWESIDSDPAIQTAQDAADAAQSDADDANALLADIADDNKITASEKQALKKEWDKIVSEKTINVTQASEFGVSSVDYVAKYDLLYAYVITDNDLLGNLTTTSTITGTTFRTKFKDYYDARTNLLNNIADKNKTISESIADGTYSGGTFIDGFTVQSGTILTNSCGLTNDDASDEPEYISGASNPSYSSDNSDIRFWGGSSYDDRATAPFRVTQAGAVTCTNLTLDGGSINWTTIDSDPAIQTAQDAADAAQSDADDANALLADIANDNKITPSEKQALKKEWDGILSEYTLNVAQASEFSVSSTDYTTAYDALYAYVVTSNNIFGSLTTTTSITGTTFRSKFKDYYDERVDLLNAIADKNKSQLESIADGTYSGGTFIDEFTVQSGTILTNSCGITNDDSSDEPEYISGGSNPSYSSADGDIRIWAGDTYANRSSAPFRVTQGGSFFAGNGTDNYVSWNGTTLTVRGGLNASDITSGTISTSAWTGSGSNYITMSRQLMYFKEDSLTKMAMGFLADKDGTETPLIVMGAGDGNGNNRGYIQKSTTGLSMYYIGDLALGEVSYLELQKDKAVLNGYEVFSTASSIGDSYISSATTWNDKISEAEAKLIVENPAKAWDIPQANLDSSTGTKLDNGASAWGKFSGAGDTLPSGNVEFNFATSTSKGGNATNTDNVGTQSATTVQNSAINFNGRNDRKTTTPANPTIDTDDSAVDHTVNTDSSSNISFEWNFSGSGDAYDIDGFIIYVYQSTSSSSYNFGTTEASEQVFYVTPEKRAFIVYGVPTNQYYTFGVQAYRIVDADVNANNVLKSNIVQPSLAAEDPYKPSSSVAFSGDVTGTITGGSTKTATEVVTGVVRATAAIDSNNDIVGRVKPTASMLNPSTAGLYHGNDYIGFHNGNGASDGWIAYMQNDSGTGKFKVGSTATNNYVEWNGSTLSVRGSLNASDISAGTISAAYVSTEIAQVNTTLSLGSTSSDGRINFKTGAFMAADFGTAGIRVSCSDFYVTDGNIVLGDTGLDTEILGDISIGNLTDTTTIDFTNATVTGLTAKFS